MIVLGEGEEYKNLERALATIRKHVDAAYVTITGDLQKVKETEEICKKYDCIVSYHRPLWIAPKDVVEWLKNFFKKDPYMKEGDEVFLFDEARNFNMAQVPEEYEWIMWMDADDIFKGGEFLHRVVEIGAERKLEAIYFEYLYQVEYDEYPEGVQIKHVLIKHLRERVVRNNGAYKWIAPIHETLIEQRPTLKEDNYDCQVVHLATYEDRTKSLTRNLKNLELAIYKTDGKDPRHIYYLAKALFDLNTPETDDQAAYLIINHYILGDHPSGWPEERAQAWEYLSETYKRRGKVDEAVKACMNSLIEEPQQPTPFINLASCYMLKGDWERALFWVRIAHKIPEKKTTLVQNPKDIQGRTLEIIYNCSLNLNKIDEAWGAMIKLQELFPDHPSVQQGYEFISAVRTERELTKSYVTVTDYLKKSGQWAKIKPLLASVPAQLEGNPFITDLVKQNMPPKTWDKDEIAIYCGPGFTNWSPKRLIDPGPTFVGGSEEAVILMSKNLSKQGWKVTVYADPGPDEGEYDGVKWLPYYKLNRSDQFNILVGWRDIRFFDYEWKAKKTYLWAHDIQSPIEYTKERVDRITKVFFLSQWHRDNVPVLPGEKVMITSNGL